MSIQSKTGIRHQVSAWGGEQFLIIPEQIVNTLGGSFRLLDIYVQVFGQEGLDAGDDPDSTRVGGWIGPDNQRPDHVALGLARFADETSIQALVNNIEAACGY